MVTYHVINPPECYKGALLKKAILAMVQNGKVLEHLGF